MSNKFCPLTFNNSYHPPKFCDREDCAWWNADREKCAVAVIAQDAANRLWDVDREEERKADIRKRERIPDYEHERAMGRL